MTVPCDLYLRLSDFRDDDEGFEGRERKLRKEASRLGWTVRRVVVENDLTPGKNGRARPASAFKRKRVPDPRRPGEWIMRVIRPGFQSVVDDLKAGRAGAMLAEDLDRACRDPRDLEDLIDAVEQTGASARSLSGSLTLTDGGTDAEISMARVMVTMANKSSRDTARRVAASRKTRAENGCFGGGRRGYGLQPDPEAPKGGKTLLIVPEEARVLQAAADDILDRGITLRAVARDLRERGVLTVTGVPWTAAVLRDALLKPAIAGKVAHAPLGKDRRRDLSRMTLHDASWPAILEPDRWEALRDKLTDPGRRTSPGNEPRWLVSLIALCGICDDGTTVHVGGGKRGPDYICSGPISHMRRSAGKVEEVVSAAVVARLSQPDVAGLLRPPDRAGVDTSKLRAEARRLREQKQSQVRLHAAGDLDDDQLAEGSRFIRGRLAAIEAELATATEPDRLAEFRGDVDAQAVWDSLPLARQRAIVDVLMVVTLDKPTLRGPVFDVESVRIEWR